MKNMDPLNDNVATLLHQSADRFVAELWKDGKQLALILVPQLDAVVAAVLARSEHSWMGPACRPLSAV